MKAGHPIQNTVSTGDLNRGRRACPACFLCYFLHAAKSNSPFPFRELPDKQEARPCWGSTLRVLLLPFSLKHGRLAHIRSQFSLFRRSPTHKNLPLATFCTSEQLLLGSFCRSKKNKTVPLSETFHCIESMPLSGQHAARAKNFRGFANLESMHRKGGFHKPIKTFFRRAEIHGASRRRPLPVHAKRVTGLLRKHS